MNIIITMAGLGSRFRNAGFDMPKYMIVVRGKTLFEWSMDSLVGYNKSVSRYVFVVQRRDDASAFIRSHMHKYGISDIVIVEIDGLTDGQATTCLEAIPFCNSDAPILIYNIDTYVEPGALTADDIKGDGFIPCFHAAGSHWSFARLNDKGQVVEVREKDRISDNCSLGAYYFGAAELFAKVYDEYFVKEGNQGAERFIAPMYNWMIRNGYEVGISIVPAEKVHVLGTPEEVQKFAEQE